MELRQLEYFKMVSNLKNITRAAERLNVSQPNITVAIKKLEAELGVRLFDRSQKQLSLTPEGNVFLTRIEIALQQVKDAVLEVNDYMALQKGTIRIGIPPMIGSYLFPRIFRSFRDNYPYLDLFLFEEGSMKIRERLEKNELDFGIVILANASNKLKTITMSKAHVVACVSEKNPLANCPYISTSDLSTNDVIMLRKGSYLRHMLMQKLEKDGIEPHIILESNQIETIKGLVAQNAGITFLLDFVVDGTKGIKTLPFEKDLTVDLGLAWKKARYINQASQSFISFCKGTLSRNK